MAKGKEIKASDLDLKSKVVKVKRVTKVIKGGRIISFSALVVMGDMQNMVGVGFGKARSVPEAVEKATNHARKSLRSVPVLNGTIPHEVRYKYKSTRILLKPAAPGTGIIAGWAMRTLLQLAGVKDVVAKILRNPDNVQAVLTATINGFGSSRDPYTVAKLRGISLEKLFNG